MTHRSKSIVLYHSPDADDAFMFYGLATGQVPTHGYTFEYLTADIQTLNQMTLRGEVDFSALSVHAYAHVADRYLICKSGASLGGVNYGPRCIARRDLGERDLGSLRIGLPGAMTSATLAMKLFCASRGLAPEFVQCHFDEIVDKISSGELDAGVVIHEGQITYERLGCKVVLDLGAWWWETNRCALPLGINVIRRDLGPQAISAVATAVRESIEFGLKHRDRALEYALTFGRGITREEADTYIGMYVNSHTVELEEIDMRSIRSFLTQGAEAGIVPSVPVEFAE